MHDFSEYFIYTENILAGRRKKCWLTNGTNVNGIFKTPKIPGVTTDHVSEYIAFLLASKLNIPVAKVELGYLDGVYGSFCYRIDALIEGIKVMNVINPSLNEETLLDDNGNRYSVDMLIDVCDKFSIDIRELISLLIFDYLIGNSDRHVNNWGLIFIQDHYHFAPLFDNGSSLCCYENEDSIEKYYFGNDKQKLTALVTTKSKTVISIDNIKRPAHILILKYLLSRYKDETISCIVDVIGRLSFNDIDDIMKDNDVELLLTINKIKLIKMFLKLKLKILKDLVEVN